MPVYWHWRPGGHIGRLAVDRRSVLRGFVVPLNFMFYEGEVFVSHWTKVVCPIWCPNSLVSLRGPTGSRPTAQWPGVSWFGERASKPPPALSM